MKEIIPITESFYQPDAGYTVRVTKGELIELPTKDTIKILVPRHYLYGTQKPNDYKKSSTKRVTKGYSEQGIFYLYNNPIIACAVPYQSHTVRLALMDGHHRVRYLGNLRNPDSILIPTYVTNSALAASLYNIPSETRTITILNSAMDEALYAFDRHLAHYHKQHLIPAPQPIDCNQVPILFEKFSLKVPTE